jgi:hypothetical protein
VDKPVDGVLAKVSPDRRRFVQTLIGLAGYGVPAVRSFVMATAIGPVLSAQVSTTHAPTTTLPSWRPRPNHLVG